MSSLVLVALLAISLPTGHAGSSSVAPARPIAPGSTTIAHATQSVMPSPPRSVPPLLSRLTNSTLGVPGAVPSPSAAPPTSAVFAAPAPVVPPTTPIVETLPVGSSTCCFYGNFVAPTGPFALIELNYTGVVSGNVYDSSYRAYVDGAPILFGTTPEYGQWTVLKDITQYSALFQGTVNVTFLLSAAVLAGGSFSTSVSVLFYPVPTGAAPPRTPNVVLPIWSTAYVKPTATTLSASVSVPTNATNATLDLFAYGFETDEFWYATGPSEKAFRDVQVSVNGTNVASVFPFPYLNTGGLDLFLWRPIPAVFTLDDRPYRIDLTGALGSLEGTHTLSASVAGRDPNSDWLVMGVLFVYTSASAGAAKTLTAPSAFNVVDNLRTDHATYWDETATLAYSYSSSYTTGSGTTNVTSSVAQRFVNDVAGNSVWENISGATGMSFWTNYSGGGGGRAVDLGYGFPLNLDLGSRFVETSNTGGTYPIYGNFTTYLENVHQEWNESGTAEDGSTFAVDERVGGGGVYAGREEQTSATAAQILSITFIESQTTSEYTAFRAAGPLRLDYAHLLIGSAYQPPGPNNAETIVLNGVASPISAAIVASAGAIDAGAKVTFSVEWLGGLGNPTVAWQTPLPSGCGSPNGGSLTCTPTAPGTIAPVATVSDASGDSATAAAATVFVLADPTVSLSGPAIGVDVGGSGVIVPVVTGGAPPYQCSWSVSGGSFVALGGCAAGIRISGTAAGTPVQVGLRVTDASGFTVSATELSIPVNPVPTVRVVGPGTSPAVGVPFPLNATVTGGSGAVVVNWSIAGPGIAGGSLVNFSSGPVLVYAATATGTFHFSAWATDAAGGASPSPTVDVLVVAATGPSTSSSAAPGAIPLWAALALMGAVAALGIALVAVLILRRSPPPPPRRPTGRRPPTQSPPRTPSWAEEVAPYPPPSPGAPPGGGA
ncbi:MAG TPA: peptide-N4-asparagine amidase [Thermoplasmata archaeon]|nr:peptide-N4-asparagine amidase [Thermoplasmata archaeon]